MELAKPAFPALPQAKEDSEVRRRSRGWGGQQGPAAPAPPEESRPPRGVGGGSCRAGLVGARPGVVARMVPASP